ncbi:MAG: cysteine-rich small domain-containing protein [Eggerthellaceae bacterium]|nr:cysteine-rich small domain-containing protein [Eggerthellaceae bacterium]
MEDAKQAYENGTTFFQNRACEHFPCHEGVDPRAFNCLFCYCPLYALGPRCGGNFRYNKKGVKDCTGCTLLHEGDGGAALVKERFRMLVDLARRPELAGQGADVAATSEADAPLGEPAQ